MTAVCLWWPKSFLDSLLTDSRHKQAQLVLLYSNHRPGYVDIT
eukprot:COSAG06_NODE_1313_length_9887_cov_27.577953_8_plen_43_part_00